MAKIVRIKRLDNTTAYPVTIPDAIIDPETGKSVSVMPKLSSGYAGRLVKATSSGDLQVAMASTAIASITVDGGEMTITDIDGNTTRQRLDSINLVAATTLDPGAQATATFIDGNLVLGIPQGEKGDGIKAFVQPSQPPDQTEETGVVLWIAEG